MSDDLHFKTATELASMIRTKKIGCVELLQHFLNRCDMHNDALNAIIVLKREEATERARDADEALSKGEVWGPLHGVPMTIKESYNWAGTLLREITVWWGSAVTIATQGYPPPHFSSQVLFIRSHRARAAGDAAARATTT